jgi:polyisoprenoid-binding protein YceI
MSVRFTHRISGLLMIAGLMLAACGPSAPAAEPAAAPAATPTTAPVAATEAPAADAPAATDEALPTGVHTYVIVPEETTASYNVDEEFFGGALGKYGIPAGLSDTVGRTNAVTGQFQFNWDDLTAPLGENTFTVDLSTLESNQSLRDSWIRENGPQFNDYPEAVFVAESLVNAPSSYTPGSEVTFDMVGQLTVRDVTQPATFAVTATFQENTITGTAVAALKMSDFGITPPDFANTLTVKDDFEVILEFTAREQ